VAARAGAAFLIVAALSATLLPAAAWADEAPYKVGWVMSLSGPSSGTAGTANLAIQVAVERANAEDLAGRKIVLVPADDASDPKTSAQVCARLVIEEKVRAIIGAQPTPSRLACNQAAVKAGLPYIAASGSAGDICLPNMFYVGQVPNQFVLPLADYLLKQNLKRIYLFGADYSAPRAALAMAKKDIEAHGGTVVGMSFSPQDMSDFSADLGKIAAALVIFGVALYFLADNAELWLHASLKQKVTRLLMVIAGGGAVYFSALWCLGFRLKDFNRREEEPSM
jgi:branched-chain amino acid transport system substrate-binding protein